MRCLFSQKEGKGGDEPRHDGMMLVAHCVYDQISMPLVVFKEGGTRWGAACARNRLAACVINK